MGYKAVRSRVIRDLLEGNFQHEARTNIDVKNKLLTGEITAIAVAELVKRSNGSEHSCSPHHFDSSIEVHVIATGGWYIKFYFLDPHTMFISVHQ
jgi:hypothetical protein